MGRHTARRQLPSFSLSKAARTTWQTIKRKTDKFFEHEPWREWEADQWAEYIFVACLIGFAGLGIVALVLRIQGTW